MAVDPEALRRHANAELREACRVLRAHAKSFSEHAARMLVMIHRIETVSAMLLDATFPPDHPDSSILIPEIQTDDQGIL